MQRWVSLDVTVPRKEFGPVLTALSGPGPVPKLYNLSVHPVVQSYGIPTTSKSDILGGVIPSLRRLSLTNFKVEIHKLMVSNLTHLSLASSVYQPATMTVLLDFLGCSPLLQGLELRYPGRTGDSAHPDHVVSLKHLRRIILWHRGPKFLNHLALPDGIEYELNFRAKTSAMDGFLGELFGEPPERFEPIFQAESLSIVPDYDHGSVRFLGPSGFVEILPDFPSKNPPIARFLIYPPPVLNKIKNLFVGSRHGTTPRWKSTDVREHLNKMASLESLTVMRCNNASFMQALLPAEGKVPCPTLKNLTIHIGPTEDSSIPAFRSMVEQRGLHGHEFEKMVLILSDEYRIHPAIPNLEVKVDDRELFWDWKKKLWRYPDEGEAYWEDDRFPGIMPVDPSIPGVEYPGVL
jgi:hypothetical protein